MSWRNLAAKRQPLPFHTTVQLTTAYKSVLGKQTEETEIVLADFAAHTGFYQVEAPGADLSQFQAGYNAGLRAAFGHLLGFLHLSDAQMRELENAAQQEAASLQGQY